MIQDIIAVLMKMELLLDLGWFLSAVLENQENTVQDNNFFIA